MRRDHGQPLFAHFVQTRPVTGGDGKLTPEGHLMSASKLTKNSLAGRFGGSDADTLTLTLTSDSDWRDEMMGGECDGVAGIISLVGICFLMFAFVVHVCYGSPVVCVWCAVLIAMRGPL